MRSEPSINSDPYPKASSEDPPPPPPETVREEIITAIIQCKFNISFFFLKAFHRLFSTLSGYC